MATAVETPDVKPAADPSSTATAATGVIEAPPTSAPEPNLDLSTYTPDEVREWKRSGAVPELSAAPEPKAASAPAKEPAGASAGDKPADDKPATESAPVSQQDNKKGKSNAQTRIQELLKQNAALKAELATKAAPPTPATEAKKDDIPAPSPAARLPKVEKPVKPAKPVWGEDPNEEWDAFEKRSGEYDGKLEQYHESLITYSLAEDRREREKERVEAETASQNQAIARDWSQRVTAVKTQPGYENYDEAIAPLLVEKNAPIPTGSVADAFILDSAVGPQLLFYFAQHLDEAEAVGHMAPLRAARVLAMLEQDLLHPPAPEKPEKPEPKAEAAPPPAKPAVTPITRAARPATDLKATNAKPVSEIEAAVAADDFDRFKRIRDQETIERRKRG